MNGYICFYKGVREEVYADTTLAAQTKFETLLKEKHKVRKVNHLYMSVTLAEKDGEPVVHIPTE